MLCVYVYALRACLRSTRLAANALRWPFFENLQDLRVSELYKEDFKKSGGVMSMIKKYAGVAESKILSAGNFKTEYFDYNWGLNSM